MFEHKWRVSLNYTIAKCLILTFNTQATKKKSSFKLRMYGKGDSMPSSNYSLQLFELEKKATGKINHVI